MKMNALRHLIVNRCGGFSHSQILHLLPSGACTRQPRTTQFFFCFPSDVAAHPGLRSWDVGKARRCSPKTILRGSLCICICRENVAPNLRLILRPAFDVTRGYWSQSPGDHNACHVDAHESFDSCKQRVPESHSGRWWRRPSFASPGDRLGAPARVGRVALIDVDAGGLDPSQTSLFEVFILQSRNTASILLGPLTGFDRVLVSQPSPLFGWGSRQQWSRIHQPGALRSSRETGSRKKWG